MIELFMGLVKKINFINFELIWTLNHQASTFNKYYIMFNNSQHN